MTFWRSHFWKNASNSETIQLAPNDRGIAGDAPTDGEKSVVCSEGFPGDSVVGLIYAFFSFIESFFSHAI
jgi:hypothetical protein